MPPKINFSAYADVAKSAVLRNKEMAEIDKALKYLRARVDFISVSDCAWLHTIENTAPIRWNQSDLNKVRSLIAMLNN